MQGLIAANMQALEQVLSLINLAKGTAYVEVAEGMTSSMGRHVRHILDHYTVLQIGTTTGEIDYDRRSRESHVEVDAAHAIDNIHEIINWLRKSVSNNVSLKMKTEIFMDTQQSICIDSSLQRELTYLHSHTVHHIAQISLALRVMGIKIDDQMGIAPATLTYLRATDISDLREGS